MSWMDRWRDWRSRGRESDRDATAEASAESSNPELANLLARARDLPDGLAPGRDLWSGIENQISGATSKPAPSPWSLSSLFPRPLAAAAVGLLLVASTAITVSFLSGPSASPSADSATELANVDSSATEIARLAAKLRERDGVADVHRSILALLDEHRAELPPETVAVLDENLRSIDRAIAEIHLALESNPDHHALSFLLAEAYRSEAELLERLEWWLQSSSEATS